MKYLIALLFLSGCYTAEKATNQVNKADSKYPEIVAKLARDKYPCTDLLKPDTAVVFKDTTIYIDCPEVVTTNNFETVRTDTVNHVITKTVRVPVNIPIKTQVVTKWYEDSAKLKLYAVALNKAIAANEKLQASNDTLQNKVARKSKENWIWRIIALCLIAWQAWKFYRRLTTIKVT